ESLQTMIRRLFAVAALVVATCFRRRPGGGGAHYGDRVREGVRRSGRREILFVRRGRRDLPHCTPDDQREAGDRETLVVVLQRESRAVHVAPGARGGECRRNDRSFDGTGVRQRRQ